MLLRTSGKLRWSFERGRPLSRVRALVTDFDGVLTDNRVVVDQDGRESVACHRGDGWGIALLKQAGIAVACISTERNPVVQARCQKLDIPYWQGQRDKLSALRTFLAQTGIRPEDCIYVGNDTNDAACLEYVGLAVVPRDAAPEVLHLTSWQTQAVGGAGVIREIAASILEERQVS
jgi:N-acylneuraminate cytidylyltransferase